MSCPWHDGGDIELYFYGEGDRQARARFDAHLEGCDTCRAALADLEVMRRLLAGRPRVSAPKSGDWAPFMRRLDENLDALSNVRRRRARLRIAVRVAAMIAITVVGVWTGMEWQRARRADRVGQPDQATTSDAEFSVPIEPLSSAARDHLERSKLVLLGLSVLDPGAARPSDWSYERGLASSLLADTAQYRLVAAEQGRLGLAGVLGDLEIVLLQASLGDDADPRALERLQQLIDRRDLLMKIDIMKKEGPVGQPLRVGSAGRGYEGRSRGND